MTKAIILYDDKVASAIITASSTAGTLVADNVASLQPGKVWRSTGVASETLTFDFGEKVSQSVIALFNHSCTPDAEIRIEISDNADFSAPAYDGITEMWEPIWGFGDAGFGEDGFGGYPKDIDSGSWPAQRVVRPGEISGRYLRLTITDPSNLAGYLMVGKVMVGSGKTPEYNFNWGWRSGVDDTSTQTFMDDGSVWVDEGSQKRRLTITLSDLTAAEAGGWADDFLRICGTRKPFLIAPYPDDKRKRYRLTMLAMIPQGRLPAINHTNLKARSLTLDAKEI